MFYSHQLLARKAPLGQIWMAATLHAKINRKRLDKLDIIKICEEILNPSVPMALRLSGILMGGVVILYERKVKLLYDDVSRLPVEINEAWRIRPAVDPTVLPKGKAQAKYEAVTLPENMMDMELFSDVDTPKFWGMRLEDLDDQYVNVNLDDDDVFSCADHHNQAEAVNITLVDNFESGLAETDVFNHFERFDIADDGTTVNITPDEHPQVPSTLVPSPPRPEDPPQQQQHCGAPSPTQAEPQQGESLQEREEQKVKGQPTKPSKRKARGKGPQVIMDNQIMIPGNIYQTWLKDPSSLVSRRRRVSSIINLIWAIKINDLMDLPPVALMSYLDKSPLELYCPKQLMQLWKECAEAKSPKASSSGGKLSSSQEQQPRNSPPQEFPPQPQGEYQSEMEAQPMDFTDGVEKIRGNKSVEYERAYDALQGDHSLTPGSPGLSHRSASSSGGSGRGFMPLEPEIQVPSGSARSKRRLHSSGGSLGNLDPVEEEFPPKQEVRDSKLRRLSDIGPTPGWCISVLISKWMVMLVALVALGGVQASTSNADTGCLSLLSTGAAPGTCNALAAAHRLVTDCIDPRNPSKDCCDSLFVTLGWERCICQVKHEEYFVLSPLADGEELDDLVRRCKASPLLYQSISDRNFVHGSPGRAQALPPPCVTAAPRCCSAVAAAVAGWLVAAVLLLALGVVVFWWTSSAARRSTYIEMIASSTEDPEDASSTDAYAKRLSSTSSSH